jgi:hypothetical protein
MNIFHLYDHLSKENSSVPEITLDYLRRELPKYSHNGSLSLSNTLRQKSHIIGHFSSGYTKESGEIVDQFIDLKRNNFDPTLQIILCITTQNPGHPKDFLPERYEFENNVRYIFFVNKNAGFQEGTIKAFCEMDSYQAQALYEKRYSDIPDAILSLFDFKYEVLISLSILCQAYLIIIGSLASEEKTDEILKAMKLICFSRGIFPEVTDDLKRFIVDKSWWNKPFTKNEVRVEVLNGNLEIKGKISQELGLSKPLCENLELLLALIFLDDDSKTRLSSPLRESLIKLESDWNQAQYLSLNNVAKAFCAISARISES